MLAIIGSSGIGGPPNGKHGYLLFEHPASEANMRPVSGDELGKLLHDNGVPVLVLTACQSAMHEAVADKNAVVAKEALVAAIPVIDAAASKGVIHSSNASRNVSRLTRLVNTLG